MACYQRALQLRPDDADAHHYLGNVCKDQGRLDEATACYQQALRLRPNYAEVYYNQGNLLKDQSRVDEAIACYRRALELNPGFMQAYVNLGNAYGDQGCSDEAVACFQSALRLKPDYAKAYNNLGNVLKDQGKLDEAIACFRRALEHDPNFAVAGSNLLHTLHFCPGYDAAAIFAEHHRWNQQFVAPLAKAIQPHPNERSADRRLRIGYVSPDLRDHVVGRNVLPLLRQHDRRQFEIVCYADLLRPDSLTEIFRSHADAWRDVAGMTHEALAQLIRDDRIDVLVDLTLHLARNRLRVFAQKPAPVQVTFAGYPGATGLSTIDYRLTDVHLDPPGLDAPRYAEESIRLPDTFWCYDPIDGTPAVTALPALQRGHVTFGCLNNFCKINPAVLRLWAQVLKAVDRSRIVILATEGTHRQHTLDLLMQEGVAPDRVTFVAKQPRQRYLELYHGIDVGLDTIPYNGHTTSLDSYWMGVPVVTIVGQTEVGRAGVSQLVNLGLRELIGETPEQFVSIAVGLAGDLARLRELRATLRARMEGSPLMDAPRFARNIEAAYRGMWRRWCGL
jgi:predicted O-linked N-acetylglucosamine transferase (SPINDLY family)